MPDYRNVRISDTTWVLLKHRAADERKSLREIVELAVESYLKAPEGQRRTAKAEVSVVKAAVAEVVKEGAARDEWLDEPVEVVPPPVVRVAAPRLSHVLKGCKRCGHAAEAHGAFSCIKGCDCGGYVT